MCKLIVALLNERLFLWRKDVDVSLGVNHGCDLRFLPFGYVCQLSRSAFSFISSEFTTGRQVERNRISNGDYSGDKKIAAECRPTYILL